MTDIIYSDWLYIPKGVLHEPTIKASLTFTCKGYTKDEQINGWEETTTHLLVPRDFYKREYFDRRGFNVVEQIPFFDPIQLEEQIVLDDPTAVSTGHVQTDAFSALCSVRNGILSLACGAGKTVVAIKAVCQHKVPAIVVVETVDLLHQWRDAVSRFVKTPLDVGIIQGSMEKWSWKRPITIAMLQTLAKYSEDIPQQIREYFGLAIFDEAHHMSSRFFIKAAPLFYGKRIGLTATPKREDGLEGLYYAHLGKPFFRDVSQPLTPKVIFYSFDLPVDWDSRETRNEINDVTGELSFPKLWGFIGAQQQFIDKVASLILKAVKTGRKILVLSHRVDTLVSLERRIADPDMCGLVIGAVPADVRKERLHSKQVILGIMQLAKEGLDEKTLDTLFILEPFKAEGVLQQAAGRILREYPGKKEPVIGIFRLNHEVCYALASSLRKHFKKWPTRVDIQTIAI